MDINDPQNSSFVSKLWNNYYIYLLGDQGDDFLKFAEFKRMFGPRKDGEKLTAGIIGTIKGNYFYAVIKKLIKI